MTYEIKQGSDQAGRTERAETATACLERIAALKGDPAPKVTIYDRDGKEISLSELEKRSAKEML